MKHQQLRTWAEVDLDILAHNFEVIKKTAKSKVCCVIKADAYGHGAQAIAKKYENLGADFFAVSNIEEALQIRDCGVKTPIIILGYTPVAACDVLAEQNISQCVYSFDYAKELSKAAEEKSVNVKIHIKVDTGMSRLGFFCQNFERDSSSREEILEVSKMCGLIPEGIFTHFAVSDEGENGGNFTALQLEAFTKLTAFLEENGLKFQYKHCANSAAVEDYPQAHLDMVRAGIILYGMNPSGFVKNKLDIKPCLSLKSVVSHVKKIPAGATVSYGRTYTAEKDTYVATVPIGYADGYLRRYAENGVELLLRGKRCKILGRICMDQLMIDIGDMSDVKIGEIVTVIGNDGNESITADEIAELTGTINYEIVCGIGTRIPRAYRENGKETQILDYICPEN